MLAALQKRDQRKLKEQLIPSHEPGQSDEQAKPKEEGVQYDRILTSGAEGETKQIVGQPELTSDQFQPSYTKGEEGEILSGSEGDSLSDGLCDMSEGEGSDSDNSSGGSSGSGSGPSTGWPVSTYAPFKASTALRAPSLEHP